MRFHSFVRLFVSISFPTVQVGFLISLFRSQCCLFFLILLPLFKCMILSRSFVSVQGTMRSKWMAQTNRKRKLWNLWFVKDVDAVGCFYHENSRKEKNGTCYTTSSRNHTLTHTQLKYIKFACLSVKGQRTRRKSVLYEMICDNMFPPKKICAKDRNFLVLLLLLIWIYLSI